MAQVLNDLIKVNQRLRPIMLKGAGDGIGPKIGHKKSFPGEKL